MGLSNCRPALRLGLPALLDLNPIVVSCDPIDQISWVASVVLISGSHDTNVDPATGQCPGDRVRGWIDEVLGEFASIPRFILIDRVSDHPEVDEDLDIGGCAQPGTVLAGVGKTSSR